MRREIASERISYGEIAELQALAEFIDPDDTLLQEWAGTPELCKHDFIDADNEGFYGNEVCRFCGERRDK